MYCVLCIDSCRQQAEPNYRRSPITFQHAYMHTLSLSHTHTHTHIHTHTHTSHINTSQSSHSLCVAGPHQHTKARASLLKADLIPNKSAEGCLAHRPFTSLGRRQNIPFKAPLQKYIRLLRQRCIYNRYSDIDNI